MSFRYRWAVKGPLSQYAQDVRQLAKDNNLMLVDESLKHLVNPDYLCQDPPKLTKERGRKTAELLDAVQLHEASA